MSWLRGKRRPEPSPDATSERELDEWPTCTCDAYAGSPPHPVGMGRCRRPRPKERVSLAGGAAAVKMMERLPDDTILGWTDDAPLPDHPVIDQLREHPGRWADVTMQVYMEVKKLQHPNIQSRSPLQEPGRPPKLRWVPYGR